MKGGLAGLGYLGAGLAVSVSYMLQMCVLLAIILGLKVSQTLLESFDSSMNLLSAVQLHLSRQPGLYLDTWLRQYHSTAGCKCRHHDSALVNACKELHCCHFSRHQMIRLEHSCAGMRGLQISPC